MAIAVLVLWALTACAGLRLLFTSGLGRARSADAQAEAQAEAEAEVRVKEHATAGAPPTKRDIRRAERARFDTPELVRSRKESVGSLREVVEFVHPACAIVGLAFWMGYTLVHNRALAWIAFGLAATTASFGVAWFLSNRKNKKNKLFSARLIAIHGSGAALTFVLAALTALTARG